MNKRLAAIGAGVGAAALAAASLGGISLASAQDDSQRGPGEGHHRGPHGEPVTGEAAEQATAAAQAEVPDATVTHVFARPDGGYAVGMLTTDNNRVVVLLDDNFAVEEVKDAPDRGPGHHGPRGEPVTGEAAEQATAAAQAEVPDATVTHVFARPDGGYAVGMLTTDNNRVVVLLDDNFAVEEVKDAPDRGPGHHGPRGEEVTGADARKARAAARKAVKNATVKHVFARPDGGYAVGMEKKRTGKHRVVLLDEDFSVEKVFTPRGPGHGPGRPGLDRGAGEGPRTEAAGFRA